MISAFIMAKLVIGLKIAYTFVLHFTADWALQSKEMSRNKSLKLKVLLQHASIHLAVFSIGLLLITTLKFALMFALANAVVHAFIDWYLWRAYKISVILRAHLLIPFEKWQEWGKPATQLLKTPFQGYTAHIKDLMSTDIGDKIINYLMTEFKYWDDYLFGFMLGFDQMLHGVCIVIIFALMFL
jgi:hypothetical protein